MYILFSNFIRGRLKQFTSTFLYDTLTDYYSLNLWFWTKRFLFCNYAATLLIKCSLDEHVKVSHRLQINLSLIYSVSWTTFGIILLLDIFPLRAKQHCYSAGVCYDSCDPDACLFFWCWHPWVRTINCVANGILWSATNSTKKKKKKL